MKTIVRKLLFSAIAVILGTAIAYSQNTVKHVIDRGETLQSIAQRYGTTVEKIIELNPDAAQFVYVGMELTVPVVAYQETTNISISDNSPSVTNNVLPLEQTSTSSTNDIDALHWIQVSFLYGFGDGPAKYKSAYGIHFTSQRIIQDKYGIGATFGASENVGFVPFDASTLTCFIGPAFSFFPEQTKCVYLTLPLCLAMSAYFEKNQEKAEQGIDSTDQKIKFGFLTTPQINVRISKVVLSAGVDIAVSSKTKASLRVGIGLFI